MVTRRISEDSHRFLANASGYQYRPASKTDWPNVELGQLGGLGNLWPCKHITDNSVKTEKSDMFGKIPYSYSTPTVQHPIPPVNGISNDSL